MTAPIQTELVLLDQPQVGKPFRVTFNVLNLDDSAVNPSLRFDLPREMSAVSAPQPISQKLAKNQLYQFPATLMINRAGTFSFSAQMIAGEETYRFGRRNNIYVTVDRAGKVNVALQKPVFEDNVFGPNLARRMTPEMERSIRPSTIADLDGKPQIRTPENVNDDNIQGHPPASTTVSGHFGYRHEDFETPSLDDTVQDAYGTQVEAWDKDDFSADDYLGADVCDSAGNFSVTFDNNADSGLESGTADVYLKFVSGNASTAVVNSSDDKYIYQTGVLYNNIGSGSHTGQNWYADSGTSGVSDSTERGYEVLRYETLAWLYSHNLGHDTHYTPTLWFVGYDSSSGSYYTNSDNHLHIEDSDISSFDVIMHEFGHSNHESLFSDADWPPGTGGSHSFTGHYTTGLAWTEGYGDYYCLAAQPDHRYYDSYDPNNLIHIDCDANYDGSGSANGNSDGAGNSSGYDTESAVTCFLIDLFDSRNSTDDPYDWASFGGDEIYDVMRNYFTSGHRPYSIQEFFNGWHARGHAYTPKVNGQMQVHGMLQNYGSYPVLGLYSGTWTNASTWTFGGYGRGSFDVKNYSSRPYALDQLYVWVRDQNGDDVGGFGGDGNNTSIASGETRNIWQYDDSAGYPVGTHAAGAWSITAGHYQTGGVWKVLVPAESGTDNSIPITVVYDSDIPDYATVTDDGKCVIANAIPTSLHFTATADDYDSGIVGYYYSVGTSAGATNVKGWTWVDVPYQSTSFEKTITGLTLAANTKYYINFAAYNLELDYKQASTDGILAFDSTDPGAVTVTDDGAITVDDAALHFTASTSEPNGCIWGYYTRVGTSPGAGDEQDWVWNYDPDSTSTNDTITGLSLTDNVTYYITVRYYNMSYGFTDGVSNGIKKQSAPLIISGRVVLNGWTATPAGQKVTIDIRNPGTTTVVESHTVALDASGNYSFGTSLTGLRDLTCKGKKWLRTIRKNVVLGTGTLTNQGFVQNGGDADDDNSVTAFDYSILSDAFDTTKGDAKYDNRADFDGDLTITVFDYAILSDHFDQSGVD